MVYLLVELEPPELEEPPLLPVALLAMSLSLSMVIMFDDICNEYVRSEGFDFG